jgi:hypothetical protein
MLQLFDAPHLNGSSTRALPYAERRASLGELALDGSAGRTPASLVVDGAGEFVARRHPESSLAGTGSIEVGLHPRAHRALRETRAGEPRVVPRIVARLAELPARRRGAAPGIRPRSRSSPRFTACPTDRSVARCCAGYWTGEQRHLAAQIPSLLLLAQRGCQL